MCVSLESGEQEKKETEEAGHGQVAHCCCWPWTFMKSSLLPLLVFSVLFCCRCFSLEAAEEWRNFPPPELVPPWIDDGPEADGLGGSGGFFASVGLPVVGTGLLLMTV